MQRNERVIAPILVKVGVRGTIASLLGEDMTLQLTVNQLQQISAHAERTYPEECCGLLIGQFDRTHAPAAKTLLEIWEVANAWSDQIATDLNTVDLNPVIAPDPAPAEPQQVSLDKTDRYWIDPKDLLRAQRYARDHQLDIIGIYHSHPDHAAVPSECDRTLAWTQYSYLIVSVHQGMAQATCCWNLNENHQFQSEEIILR